MTNQTKLWKSEFGDDYVDRNQLTEQDIDNRMQLWNNVLLSICTPLSIPNSFLEVGAGIGGNMHAINKIFNHYGKVPELYAVEPNKKAKAILEQVENVTVIEKDALEISKLNASVDLAFTSGVLIHIHPNDQLKAMREIYRVSKKWIICIEYFSPELREVNYHGEKALWTRDYGSMWLDNFKLRCVAYSFTWKRMSGLDNVTTWIFEKVH